MTRGQAFVLAHAQLRTRLTWSDGVLDELLRHPRRCAPNVETFATITRLPYRVALALWKG